MSFITASKLDSLSSEQKRKFQELFPELIKRLIVSEQSNVRNIRFPHLDDIWAPGFDGIVESTTESRFVARGTSVWELGTNADSLEKINSDYAKRTKNSLDVDKGNATIYLVVPKIWAYKISLVEWENSKSEWKRVRVYDASILCDWINECPNVCAWLFEEVFGEHLGFYTLKEAWKRFSKKTSPPLSSSMFLSGRDESINYLFNKINDNLIIRVKSNITIDAFGFCLAALLTNNELSQKIIVIKDKNTYLRFSREYKNKIFLLDFMMTDDLDASNINILCYCKEDTSIHADVDLGPLNKGQFKVALKDMGVAEHEIDAFYEFTHGHILALIRKIPGTSTMSSPMWKNQGEVQLLAPLMFVRNYNMSEAADRYLLERLTDVSYAQLNSLYTKWEALEDAPLRYVNGYYCTIVNFEEAWETLNIKACDYPFKRLANIILELCSGNCNQNIPKDFLLRCQKHLRNLFLNLIYVSYSEPNSPELTTLIQNILDMTKNGCMSLIMDNLSVIAEASPKTVMDYLQNDITSPESVVLPFLQTYKYSTVLHALSVLCTFDETKIRACNLLFKLMDQECGKAYSNSPKDSLLTALCLWHDEGALTLDDKVRIVKKYLEKSPVKAAYFVVDLIRLNSIMLSVRLGARRVPGKEKITTKQLVDAVNELAIAAFDVAHKYKKLDLIKKVVDCYRHLTKETLIHIADSFVPNNYSADEIIEFNFELRQKLIRILKNKDEEEQYWVEPLHCWKEKTTLEGTFNSNAWAFINYDICPALDLIEDEESKLYGVSPKQKQLRQNIFKKCESDLGDGVYSHISSVLHNDAGWGYFFAEMIQVCKYRIFVDCLLKENKICILSAFVDSVDIDSAKTILLGLQSDVQCKVLNFMHRLDIVDILENEEMKKAFWCHQHMREYSEIVYSNLLVYNPLGLVNYYVYNSRMDLSSVCSDVINLLEALTGYNQSEKRYQGCFEIDELVKKLDDFFYSEKFAQICVKLYANKLIGFIPDAMARFYFDNPLQMVNEIKDSSGNGLGYSFFWHDYRLPFIAYSQFSNFKSFCDILMLPSNGENADILGSIFGRCIDNHDGMFPHEFIMRVLDEYDDEKINRNFLVGKMNSIGVRNVSDGSDEKSIAERYKLNAQSIEIDYPVTAELLRLLAEQHLRTAGQDSAMYQLGFNI